MNTKTIYVKLNQNVMAKGEDVFLKDIASVFCEDKVYESKANALKVAHFHKQKKKTRAVISIIKIVQDLTGMLPGVTVNNLGETDTIIEYLPQTAKSRRSVVWCKVAFVACICFWGTAFSIMTFHNDVGVPDVFAKLYEMVTGQTSNHKTILEWSYTAGLGIGIIVFYNHIGGRRLSKDPTPLEVEMRNYERDVNLTLVETSEREGLEIDVDENNRIGHNRL